MRGYPGSIARKLTMSDADRAPAANRDERLSAKEAKRQAKQAKKQSKAVDARLKEDLHVDDEALRALKRKLAKAESFPDRGVETWFRLTSRNLYTRRQIVDAKSNILVTINALILSVILGSLYDDLKTDPHLAVAIVPLVVANLLSILFAILATRPRLSGGVFSDEDISAHRVSLMTFDDFYAMSAPEYEVAVDRILSDRDLLYGSIKRDIHALGVDLSHRYLHIRRAYGIFMLGITLGAVLFGACHALM